MTKKGMQNSRSGVSGGPDKDQGSRQAETARVEVQHSRTEYFQGILPHPDHLREYEKILPGFAERVLRMAEKDQESAIATQDRNGELLAQQQRAQMELMQLAGDENKRTQWFALVAMIAALSASVFLAHLGAFVASGAVGTTTVVGVVAAFINDARTRSKPAKKES